MPGCIIELGNVSAGYGRYQAARPDESRLVNRDISLGIQEGSCVCLLGPNGCGKTTLLRVIAGLLPAYGDVRIDGRNIRSLKRREIASCISFLSQMPQIYYSYTVFETVMQGRYVHHSSFFKAGTSADMQIVEEILETLGLRDLARKQITSLSGGQLQRVMLARCIAQNSPVLILDEPMNHLDLKVQSEFIEFLTSWRQKIVVTDTGRKFRPTIIGVFHDIGTAAYMADQIALLSGGRLLAFDEKKNVLNEELLRRAYDFDVTGYLRTYRIPWKFEI
jgi:iron complex transport system ATP-binding protein